DHTLDEHQAVDARVAEDHDVRSAGRRRGLVDENTVAVADGRRHRKPVSLKCLDKLARDHGRERTRDQRAKDQHGHDDELLRVPHLSPAPALSIRDAPGAEYTCAMRHLLTFAAGVARDGSTRQTRARASSSDPRSENVPACAIRTEMREPTRAWVLTWTS